MCVCGGGEVGEGWFDGINFPLSQEPHKPGMGEGVLPQWHGISIGGGFSSQEDEGTQIT